MTFDPWQPEDPREGVKPGQEQVLADLLAYDNWTLATRPKRAVAKVIEIPNNTNKPEEGK